MTKITLAGVAIGAALVSLAACAKPPEPAKPAVDAAAIAAVVKANAKTMTDAMNARDFDKAVSLDDANYVGMFHGMPNLHGPAEDLAVTKQQMADPTAKVTFSDENVHVAEAGDIAIYRSTYLFSGTDPKTKKAVSETGNFIVGFKKEDDGNYKAAWSVVSDTGPAAKPIAAKPAG